MSNGKENFLERLTEAQLDGAPLPTATNEEERRLLGQFEETDALFEEFSDMRLDSSPWMSAVWDRIDTDASSANDTDAAVAVAVGDDVRTADAVASDDDDDGDTSNVIQAAHRFRWWPIVSGLAIAAVALLALSIPLTMMKTGEDESAASQADDASMAKSEAPAREQDYRGLSGASAEGERAEGLGRDEFEAPSPEPEMPSAAPATTRVSDSSVAENSGVTSAIEGDGSLGGFAGGPADGRFDDLNAMDGEGMAGAFGLEEAGEAEAPGDMVFNTSTASAPPAAAERARPSGGGKDSSKGDKNLELKDSLDEDFGAADTGWGGGGTGRGWNGDRDNKKSGWNNTRVTVRPKPRLTAGEVDDNHNFTEFMTFLNERSKPQLEPMDVSERMFVRVLDRNGRPLPNATVDFTVGGNSVFNAKTYSDGWALFHPRTIPGAEQAEGFELKIRHGQAEHAYQISRGAKEEWQVRLPVERTIASRQQVDVVFLLDTTQSMQDQIDTLQSTITDVAAQITQLPGQPEVRFGLVVFRDDTDEYLSKVFDFETDVTRFQQILAEQQAAGGGDIPERVEVGLHRSIHDMSWNQNAMRMVFLVGDAPPHKRSLNEFSYAQAIQAAASKGIKVFTVATSGLDDDGEYVFRQLAQYTMARFIFLTTGASGTTTVHDVKPGSFQPETLDKLIVRMVREEIAGLEVDDSELDQQQQQQQQTLPRQMDR